MSALIGLEDKQVELHHYDGPALVESTIYEAPLMASRAAVVSLVMQSTFCCKAQLADCLVCKVCIQTSGRSVPSLLAEMQVLWLQASSVVFDKAPLISDPSPRLLEDHQMLLSDFTQQDFTFPANLDATLQARPPTIPETPPYQSCLLQ